MTVKKSKVAAPAEAIVPETPVQEIPMLELPSGKIPIADLPPELQEMVDIYKGWLAEHQAALVKVQQAEVEIIKLKRGAFVYEAAMRSLSEEIIKRVDAFNAQAPEVAEDSAS